MRISDWSSDVCSSDLPEVRFRSLGSPVGFAGDGSGAKPSRKMIGPNNRYAKYECLTRLPELIDNDAAQPAEPGIGLRRLMPVKRSEERSVGKECVSTCRSRWSPGH